MSAMYQFELAPSFALILTQLIVLSTLNLPKTVRERQARKEAERQNASFTDALAAYLEGRFQEAEKIAAKLAAEPRREMLARVLAARAAHESRAHGRRDVYLTEAKDNDMPLAALYAEAEQKLEGRDLPGALAAIGAGKMLVPAHTALQRLELKVRQQLGQWDEVLRLAEQLSKANALDAATLEHTRRAAHLGNILPRPRDQKGLLDYWKKLVTSLIFPTRYGRSPCRRDGPRRHPSRSECVAKVSELKERARTLEQQGELAKARAIYEHILKHLEGTAALMPELPMYVKVGDLSLKLGDSAGAVAMYERAAEHYASAGSARSIGALAEKIRRADPTRDDAAVGLGRALLAHGHAGAAAEVALRYARRIERADVASLLAEIAPEADDPTSQGLVESALSILAGPRPSEPAPEPPPEVPAPEPLAVPQPSVAVPPEPPHPDEPEPRGSEEAGVTILWENYPEEGVTKIQSLREFSAVEWHMIGHVQSRKAQLVPGNFNLLHSLDGVKLAARLDRYCGEAKCKLPVVLEFNVGGEESKSGWPAGDESHWPALLDDVAAVIALPNLQVCGLMTMPPLGSDAEFSRPFFQQLRRLREYLAGSFPKRIFRNCRWEPAAIIKSLCWRAPPS